MVVEIFESTVDGSMRFGLWLYATAANEPEVLSDSCNSWANMLSGVEFWRNRAIVQSMLGWYLGGFGRADVDVASSSAVLWNLPPDDWYCTVFFKGHSNSGQTWYKRSAAMFCEWCIHDWPICIRTANGVTLDSY
jgi:hypothetical protein